MFCAPAYIRRKIFAFPSNVALAPGRKTPRLSRDAWRDHTLGRLVLVRHRHWIFAPPMPLAGFASGFPTVAARRNVTESESGIRVANRVPIGTYSKQPASGPAAQRVSGVDRRPATGCAGDNARSSAPREPPIRYSCIVRTASLPVWTALALMTPGTGIGEQQDCPAGLKLPALQQSGRRGIRGSAPRPKIEVGNRRR
jgi:hypothetical protein